MVVADEGCGLLHGGASIPPPPPPTHQSNGCIRQGEATEAITLWLAHQMQEWVFIACAGCYGEFQ